MILHFFKGQIKMSTYDLNLLYAQKFTVAENMKKYGGSFAQALGVALSHADMWNTIKIKLTWPELWEEYLNFEKKTKDSSNDR